MIVLRAFFRGRRGCSVSCVSVATRGQTDMRGLDTAGRVVRLERLRLSRIGRHTVIRVAHSRSAGRSSRCRHRSPCRPVRGSVVHDCQ